MSRVLVLLCGLGLGLTGAHQVYTRDISELRDRSRLLQTTPRGFNAQVVRRESESRRLGRPKPSWVYYCCQYYIDPSSSASPSSSTLSLLVSSVFESAPYRLERWLSGIQTRDLVEEMKLKRLELGSSYGHLKLIERPSQNDAVFRYDHEDYDFILYFGVNEKDNLASMGFIELRGDYLEMLGSRVYVPILLKAGVSDLGRKYVAK